MHTRNFSIERKIVPLHSCSVVILSAAHQLRENAYILSKTLPVHKEITTAVIGVSMLTTIPAEMEAPVMVSTSGSGLMTIERPTNLET